MGWRMFPVGWALLLATTSVAAGEEAENPPKPVFKVEHHLMAQKVGFDKRGRCIAANGRALKEWRVLKFPTQVPPFESCITISSPTERGLMDFELVIVDSKGDELLMVEGTIELGDGGKATQAVNWEHLEIPKPGVYKMVVVIEEQELGRYPMRFKRRRAGKKR